MLSWKSCFMGLFLTISAFGEVYADQTCDALSRKLQTLDINKGAELAASRLGRSYKQLYAECDTSNTFGGHQLPLFHERRLTCSTDPNRVAFLRRFPDGTIVFRAKMGVDADGSPASMGSGASPADQPHTSLHYDGRPNEFFNAEDVSFVVTPLTSTAFRSTFRADSGVNLGDLAVVMKGGRCSFGLVADEGPPFRIGEASMKAHDDLGNPQCATPGEHPCRRLRANGNGVGIGSDVTYIVFPNSRPSPLDSATVSAVTARDGSAKAAAFLDRFQ